MKKQDFFLWLSGFFLFVFSSLGQSANAQTYTESVVYSFCAQTSCADGESPYAGLIRGTDGNFYGTASEAGANGATGGTVFQLTPTGTYTVLYSFCAQAECADGDVPVAALVEGKDHNFYGTTSAGGAKGGGTVFQITSAGAFNKLYDFCAQTDCADGEDPYGALMQATDGDFYGTTVSGGAYRHGEIFKITSGGAFSVLYSFCSGSTCTDGLQPHSALLQAKNGNLYGTTEYGGANNEGTVFEFVPAGATLTTVYSFCNAGGTDCTDGELPVTALIQAKNGNLYGTTLGGGAKQEGTAYSVTAAGAFSTLYSFCTLDKSQCEDGVEPGALLQASDGNLYGTTSGGGTKGDGTVFELTTGGVLTTLYSFCAQTHCADGLDPMGGVIQANGSFWGTTLSGGANGNGADGAIFKLSVPGKIDSATALTVAPGSAFVGQGITLTATVSGAGATPTGTVTFSAAGLAIGSTGLSGGVAALTANSNGIVPGTYAAVASYGGDSTYNPSTSPTVNVTINKAPTKTTVTAAPNPVTPPGSVTLTATVKRSASGSSGGVTGKVTFYYKGTAIGTATLNKNGVATFSALTTGLPGGSYAVTATYSGDAYDNGSMSTAVTVTVN